jgi:uncharacterized integral membrane protein
MMRRVIAFIVAPMAVPIVGFPYILSMMQGGTWIAIGTVIAIILAYVGTLGIGVPLLTLLWNRRWTALWITVVVATIGGVIMWEIFLLVLFPLLLGQEVVSLGSALAKPDMLNGILWPAGVLGIATGIVLWLIARPDKEPSHSEK